jgi:hypothetical protein
MTITEEQDREIKLLAKRNKKPEAAMIRELLPIGLEASRNIPLESTGKPLLRLAQLGEELHIKAPSDLSSRIDDYLCGEEAQEEK